MTAQKDADEAAFVLLKTDWDVAKKNQANSNTEIAKAKTCLAEREKYEKDSRNQHEEAQNLFASAISTNGFENEAAYASSLISEDELAAIAQQLAEYDENGRRIRRDIKRLSNETADKYKPDLEKLTSAYDENKNAFEALRTERDETKLRLETRSQILKELKKSADALAKIKREYAAIKSLSDTTNGKLDF